METQIKGIISNKEEYHLVDIFGYCSKGLPGIEIIGMGNKGKNIKEKFVYMGRLRQLKIPLKKYVICIELDGRIHEKGVSGMEWLELPLLLLFWTLSNQITVYNLQDCLACGQVFVEGRITTPALSVPFLENLLAMGIISGADEKNKTWKIFSNISDSVYDSQFNFMFLPLMGVFSNIRNLNFETVQLERKIWNYRKSVRV